MADHSVDRRVVRLVGQKEGPRVGHLEDQKEALTEVRLEALTEGHLGVHLVGLQDLSGVRVALHRFAQLALVRIQSLREFGLEVVSV